MKRILLLVLCFILVFAFVFAGGEKEKERVKIVIVLHPGHAEAYKGLFDTWIAAHPGVDFKWVDKGARTDAIDALIAAGTPPNLYMATPQEVGRFLIPDFALEVTDKNVLKDYMPGTLDIYTREGKMLALPMSMPYNAFDINLTLAEKVGFKVPDRHFLTIDEFLQFSELIKQKAPGHYGTAIWTSGSAVVNFQWYASFGAKLFKKGDYTKTVINSPEALKAVKFMKMLYDKGYIPPEAGVMIDDEMVAMWASGKLGGAWARAGGWLGMMYSAVDQGLLDKPFEHRFMSWPKAEGVDKVPGTFGGAAVVAIATGNKRTDALALDFLAMITGAEAQTIMIGPGSGYKTRYSAKQPPDVDLEAPVYDPGFLHYQKIFELLQENGLYDTGETTLINRAIGSEHMRLLQELFAGNLTPKKFLDTFEAKINSLLAGE